MLILSLLLNIALANDYIAIPKKGCPTAIGEYVFSKAERAFLKTYSPEIACSQKVSVIGANKNYKYEENVLLQPHSLTDPLVEEQWGLKNIGLPQPFIVDDITTINTPGIPGEDLNVENFNRLMVDEKPMIVAVLDTGIDLTHPELKGQILTKTGECEAFAQYKACLKTTPTKECDNKYAKVDTDNNGYPMDCQGWNVTAKVNTVTKIMGDNDVQDKIGHGTHVSGIIAAAHNGIGVEGIAPKAKILPVKVLSSAPSSPERPLSLNVPGTKESELPKVTTYGDIFARGLLYAIRSGANVVNMSLGWPYAVDSELMRTLVKVALERKIILVSSAGNDSTSVPLFPCYYTGVICVASHAADGSFSTFSNFGTNVDVVAPGSRILSTYPMNIRPNLFNEENGYEFDQGTSMSAPYVAGVVARLLSANIPAEEIYPRLIVGGRETKVSANAKLRLYEKHSLSGNVDLFKSYKAAPRPVILPADKGQKLKQINLSGDLNFKIKLKNFWAEAKNVSITVQPKPGLTSEYVQIPPMVVSQSDWKTDEVRTIDIPATLNNPMAHSDLEFLVRISGQEGLVVNEFVYQLELVTELSTHPNVKTLAVNNISGLSDLTGTRLRTLKGLNQYVLLKDETDEEDKDVTTLALMKKMGDEYQIYKSSRVPRIAGELQDITEIKDQLVFLTKNRNDEGKPVLEFTILNEKLEVGRKLIADSSKFPLSTDIVWVKSGEKLNPLWIAFGDKLEVPAFDPWNPDAEVEKGIFFYTLDESGVKNLNVDLKDEFLVTILPQTEAEQNSGLVKLLLAKGDKYDFVFSVGYLLGNKIVKQEVLDFTKYHMLGGVVGNLFKTKMASGVYFATETMVTELRNVPTVDGFGSTEVKQYKLKAINDLVQTQKLHGVFHTAKFDGAFTQTQNELQFHDFQTGKVSYTTLKRFSFMPNYFFDKFFYPLTIGDTPAIYIPSGLGVSFTNDMVIPVKNNGKTTLIRPALWRVLSKGDCMELNPSEEAGLVTMKYFCKDKVLEVNLN